MESSFPADLIGNPPHRQRLDSLYHLEVSVHTNQIPVPPVKEISSGCRVRIEESNKGRELSLQSLGLI